MAAMEGAFAGFEQKPKYRIVIPPKKIYRGRVIQSPRAMQDIRRRRLQTPGKLHRSDMYSKVLLKISRDGKKVE